jgi:hypothetical protein
MTVQYSWNGSTGTDLPIDAGLTTGDGVDVTASEYNSLAWWGSSIFGWWGYFDFGNVWEWNSTTNLPILRNMPAGAQNPTVQ